MLKFTSSVTFLVGILALFFFGCAHSNDIRTTKPLHVVDSSFGMLDRKVKLILSDSEYQSYISGVVARSAAQNDEGVNLLDFGAFLLGVLCVIAVTWLPGQVR